MNLKRWAMVMVGLVGSAAAPVRASFFMLSAAGTIGVNSSSDTMIPVGTPWTFELIYDTASPDVADLGGPVDPSFGIFSNVNSPPAIVFFHYKAGGYEVRIDDPAAFGTTSNIVITFTLINALDINIRSPESFPPLAGGAVSFHADFNAFRTVPIFSGKGLPTNTALSPESFDDEFAVTLLPVAGAITTGTLTSLTLSEVGDCNTNSVPDVIESDRDGDGVIDACDGCPDNPEKSMPDSCGCTPADADSDGDGVPDCMDGCPKDPLKTEPGQCGCGVADVDSDGDGAADCVDQCPNDAMKTEPGNCGCGVAETEGCAQAAGDGGDMGSGRPGVNFLCGFGLVEGVVGSVVGVGVVRRRRGRGMANLVISKEAMHATGVDLMYCPPPNG